MNNNIEQLVSSTLKEHFEEKNRKLYQFEKNKLYAYLGDFVDSLKEYKAFIAGGTITSLFTNKPINDLDIYFRDEKSFIGFIEQHWEDSSSWVTNVTNKSVLMQYKDGDDKRNVQLIHFKYFDSPEAIFNTFDFTVCMGAFDFSTEQFVLHDEFLKHNAQHILKFNKNTAFPIVSLLRVQKYNKKHYSISKTEFIRIALRCMELEIKTVEDLKEHLGGMYGMSYDKLLEFLDGEEFSLDKVIDRIADLALDEDYFKRPVTIEFNDIDDIINSITKKPIKVLTIHNKTYKLIYNGSLKHISKNPPIFEEVDGRRHVENSHFYKFVKKSDDGTYRSFWDNNFKYEIGKVAEAKNDYLYFNEKHEIEKSTYRNQGVLLEVKITYDDFRFKEGDKIHAKRCTPIREVSTEEYEKWKISIVSDDDYYECPFAEE